MKAKRRGGSDDTEEERMVERRDGRWIRSSSPQLAEGG